MSLMDSKNEKKSCLIELLKRKLLILQRQEESEQMARSSVIEMSTVNDAIQLHLHDIGLSLNADTDKIGKLKKNLQKYFYVSLNIFLKNFYSVHVHKNC